MIDKIFLLRFYLITCNILYSLIFFANIIMSSYKANAYYTNSEYQKTNIIVCLIRNKYIF